MRDTAKKFETEVNEVKAMCFTLMADEDVLMNMDAKALGVMQKTMALCNTAVELTVKQANMMADMNEKLDKLLKAKN